MSSAASNISTRVASQTIDPLLRNHSAKQSSATAAQNAADTPSTDCPIPSALQAVQATALCPVAGSVVAPPKGLSMIQSLGERMQAIESASNFLGKPQTTEQEQLMAMQHEQLQAAHPELFVGLKRSSDKGLVYGCSCCQGAIVGPLPRARVHVETQSHREALAAASPASRASDLLVAYRGRLTSIQEDILKLIAHNSEGNILGEQESAMLHESAMKLVNRTWNELKNNVPQQHQYA